MRSLLVLLLWCWCCGWGEGRPGVELALGKVKNAVVTFSEVAVLDTFGVMAYTVDYGLRQYLFEGDDREAIQNNTSTVVCSGTVFVVTPTRIVTVELKTDAIDHILLPDVLNTFTASCHPGVVRVLSQETSFEVRPGPPWQLVPYSAPDFQYVKNIDESEGKIKSIKYSYDGTLCILQMNKLVILHDSKSNIINNHRYLNSSIAVATQTRLVTCDSRKISTYEIGDASNVYTLSRETDLVYGECSDLQLLHNGVILVTFPEVGALELTWSLELWRVARYSVSRITLMAASDRFTVMFEAPSIKVSTADVPLPFLSQRLHMEDIIDLHFIYSDEQFDIFALVSYSSVIFVRIQPTWIGDAAALISLSTVTIPDCPLSSSTSFGGGMYVVGSCGLTFYVNAKTMSYRVVPTVGNWTDITTCDDGTVLVSDSDGLMGSLLDHGTAQINVTMFGDFICDKLFVSNDSDHQWGLVTISNGVPSLQTGDMARVGELPNLNRPTHPMSVLYSDEIYLVQGPNIYDEVLTMVIPTPGVVLTDFHNGFYTVGGDTPGFILVGVSASPAYIYSDSASLEQLFDTYPEVIQSKTVTWETVFIRSCFFVGVSASLFGASVSPGILLAHVFVVHLAVKADSSVTGGLFSWGATGDSKLSMFVVFVMVATPVLGAVLIGGYVELGKLLPLKPLEPPKLLMEFVPKTAFHSRPERILSYSRVGEHLNFPTKPLLFLSLFTPLLVENFVTFSSVVSSLVSAVAVAGVVYGVFKQTQRRTKENEENHNDDDTTPPLVERFNNLWKRLFGYRSKYPVTTLVPSILLAVVSGVVELANIPSAAVLSLLLTVTVVFAAWLHYCRYRNPDRQFTPDAVFQCSLCVQLSVVAISLLLILFQSSVGISTISLCSCVPTLCTVAEAVIETREFTKKTSQPLEEEADEEEEEEEEEDPDESVETSLEGSLRRVPSASFYESPDIADVCLFRSGSGSGSGASILPLSVSCRSLKSPKRKVPAIRRVESSTATTVSNPLALPDIKTTPKLQPATSVNVTPDDSNYVGDLNDFFAPFQDTVLTLLKNNDDDGTSTCPGSPSSPSGADKTMLISHFVDPMLSASVPPSSCTNLSSCGSSIQRAVSAESRSGSNLLSPSLLRNIKQNTTLVLSETNTPRTPYSQNDLIRLPHTVSVESPNNSASPFSPSSLAKGRQKALLHKRQILPEDSMCQSVGTSVYTSLSGRSQLFEGSGGSELLQYPPKDDDRGDEEECQL